jgi:hypothetical protein
MSYVMESQAYSGTDWYRERLAAEEARAGVPGTRQRQATAGVNEQRGRRGAMEYAATFGPRMTPRGQPAKLSPARAKAIRQSRLRQHARALGLALSPADERRREALRQRARSLFRASDDKMLMRARRRLASIKNR